MAEERSNEFHNVVPLQIRFNDVDKFGHVNNTIYFQFYDSGKTDYVSTVCKGFDWDQHAIFVVKIEVEFFAQIKGADRIAVRTRTVKLGNKSFHLEQEIFDTDTQEVKSRCLSILVLYPSSTTTGFGKPWHIMPRNTSVYNTGKYLPTRFL